MFSLAQKRDIAAKVEAILLSYGHPEMPREKPNFKLHVDGKENWSWADIEPNWVYEAHGNKPGISKHNEMAAILCNPPPSGPAVYCPQCEAYHTPSEPCIPINKPLP